MSDVQFWTRKLREAEAELDAAKTRGALDAAAKKLQRARAALKALTQWLVSSAIKSYQCGFLGC